MALPGDAFASLTREDVEAIIAEACDSDDDAHVSMAELADFVKRGRAALGSNNIDQSQQLSANSLKLAKLLIIYEDAGNDLRDAFSKFDVSGDGEVSVAELHNGLHKLGQAFDSLTRADVEAIVKEAFKKESHITYGDFASFVSTARRSS